MNTMQKRLLERIERDVEAAGQPRSSKDSPVDPAWMTFDPTVASNVGLIQVGRESDVGPRRQMRADFQPERARFENTSRRPDIAREPGSTLGATALVVIDYAALPEKQAREYARLLDYLTAPLRTTAAEVA